MPQAHRLANEAASEDLLVAESFRVRINPQTGAAEVRGLEHHLARFARSTHAASGGALRGVSNFLDETSGTIAAYGDGFPRWELWRAAHGDFELRLSLRPLPELGDALSLTSTLAPAAPHSDRKGPNIFRYAALNRALGAEALLGELLGALEPAAVTPAELAECEVWAVNALHGIRVVANIDGVDTRAPDSVRLTRARAALDQTWQPFLAAER